MTTGNNKHYLPTPLDFLVLEQIPEDGIIGGVHWAGRPLKYVRDSINAGLPDGMAALETSTVHARMRSMKVAGFVIDHASHGSGRIWARTKAGTEFLATKEEVLGS